MQASYSFKFFVRFFLSQAAFKSPLFLPIKAPKSSGFTVVILTFDRIDSLFQVVRQVGRVPSLAKILIIWNNQDIKPPACVYIFIVNDFFFVFCQAIGFF